MPHRERLRYLDDGARLDGRVPTPAPPEVELTPNEEKVWAPLPPDRSEIPVLLYHGIGPASDYSNSSDAAYGVDETASQSR